MSNLGQRFRKISFRLHDEIEGNARKVNRTTVTLNVISSAFSYDPVPFLKFGKHQTMKFITIPTTM